MLSRLLSILLSPRKALGERLRSKRGWTTLTPATDIWALMKMDPATASYEKVSSYGRRMYASIGRYPFAFPYDQRRCLGDLLFRALREVEARDSAAAGLPPEARKVSHGLLGKLAARYETWRERTGCLFRMKRNWQTLGPYTDPWQVFNTFNPKTVTIPQVREAYIRMAIYLSEQGFGLAYPASQLAHLHRLHYRIIQSIKARERKALDKAVAELREVVESIRAEESAKESSVLASEKSSSDARRTAAAAMLAGVAVGVVVAASASRCNALRARRKRESSFWDFDWTYRWI